MYVCMYVFMYSHTYVMKNRPNFEDAPQGSAIFDEETTKFSGCSARERDVLQNFQDARTGARFSSKF